MKNKKNIKINKIFKDYKIYIKKNQKINKDQNRM